MQPTLSRAALAAALLSVPTAAQILPGHSIATVAVTSLPSEMYDVDHQAGTATMLTVNPSLAAEVLNCVLMTSAVSGYVGTNTTGNIYAITVAGGIVTETLLNTTANAGGNVSQLALLNGRIYYTTQVAGLLGALQSIPQAGGAVQLDLNLATLGATGLANACAVIGNKVYVATFNSSPVASATSPGEVFEFDTATNTGRLVLNLPPGGFAPSAAPWNTGIVNMYEDPQNPGILALAGVYGDLLRIDPVANTVYSATWTGLLNAAGTGLASGTINSFAFDPIAQDWIVGTRYGAIERWVGNQQAENKILGVGSSPTTTSNSITGLWYNPTVGGGDVSYAAGCGGNGGWTPTDTSFGGPNAGNTGFRFGLYSAAGGDLVVLMVDFQNAVFGGIPTPIDLTTYGAPGCAIATGNLIIQFLVAAGTGEGQGHATVALPLPTWATGLSMYHQWAELQQTPTNALNIVVSNARHLTVQ